jgi:hypothetical protein
MTSGSGDHPIGDPPKRADAAHVMTTATRYDEQQDTSAAPGRFGRKVELDSVAETRKAQVDHMRKRVHAGYRVDPHAVADAIIARLEAGGTVKGGARNPASSARPPAR